MTFKKELMNIVLIGYMGSGKSLIGSHLAKKIDYKFIDLDQYIEKNEACSISKIFKFCFFIKYSSRSRGPSKDSKKIFNAFGGIYKSSEGRDTSSPLRIARLNSACLGWKTDVLTINIAQL